MFSAFSPVAEERYEYEKKGKTAGSQWKYRLEVAEQRELAQTSMDRVFAHIQNLEARIQVISIPERTITPVHSCTCSLSYYRVL